MRSKRKWLQCCRLYLILDTEVSSYDELLRIVKRAVPAGVDMIQLRDKNGLAKDIVKFSKEVLRFTRHKIPYIINDRVDLAKVVQASGVHLGQDDLSIVFARKVLGSQAIVGVSCQTLTHVTKAIRQKADYIGFGSVFRTLTKPERIPQDLNLVKQVVKRSPIPFFAIGGVGLNNIGLLTEAGVKRVAVCRAICQTRDINQVVKNFKAKLR